MSFAFLIIALAVAGLGQVGNAQLGCGIGYGQDICTYKRPVHVARLPVVVRPVDLPRPVIEPITLPRPTPPPVPVGPVTLTPPLPVPPLLPVGGPCSCKKTLVRPAIVPRPVCQPKCTTCVTTGNLLNQRTITTNQFNKEVIVGHGCRGNTPIITDVLGTDTVRAPAVVDTLVEGPRGLVSEVETVVGGVNNFYRGDHSYNSYNSYGALDTGYGGVETVVGGGDTVIESNGGATVIENGYGRHFAEDIDVIGGGSTVIANGPGTRVETIVDGPYVDTIVGGRKCVDVPYGSQVVKEGGVTVLKNPHTLAADAVSMSIAYNLAKKACEQSEDKLAFGFRQMPKELPRRVISRRVLGRRIPEEGNLYQLNGEVVELKAPSKISAPKSLAEEAAEELLDLVAEEQDEGVDYALPIRKVTLGEIGYAPTKQKNPTFVEVPPVVSEVVEAVEGAVASAVNSAIQTATCHDGFKAGNVAVMPVPQPDLMLSRPKLETLLEPCSSEEEYAPLPYAVQYTSCNSKSHSSHHSKSGSLISKLVAKLI